MEGLKWESWLGQLGTFHTDQCLKTSGAKPHVRGFLMLGTVPHEFHGRNKNNKPKNNAEQFHIWFPPAPLAWNHTQLYKCREVFTTFPCALRVNVELMCAGGCQQPSRPLLLITDMSSLNVMLEHRCNIQASAAPPLGRVWRTHAIPHICSISDCITQDLLTFQLSQTGPVTIATAALHATHSAWIL